MIRHLLVTDIRRFRWILAAWLSLVVVYALLLYVTPGLVGSPRYDGLITAIVLLFLVTHLAPLVLVPLIVQADAPVGTDTFWVTRPIPPRALLAAKALLLTLVIVIVPALLELGAMIAARVAPAETVRIALDTVLTGVAWLALLMAASALTPTYPKFALLCASVVVAMALYLVVLQAILTSRMRGGGAYAMLSVGPAPLPDAGDGTQGLIFLLGVILSACALLAVQYRRRQRIVSVPFGVVGVVLAFLAATWWPWPLLRAESRLPDWTSGLRLTAESAVAPFDAPSPFGVGGDQWRIGRLPLRTGGVSPEWFATASMRNASITLPDGTVIGSRSRGFGASPAPEGTNEPPQRVVMRHVLSVNRLADRWPPRGENVVAIVVSPDEYRLLEPAAVTYRGEFAVDLSRVDVAGTLPLRPDAAFNGGVYQLALRQTRRTPQGTLAFNAIETRATSTFDSGPRENYLVYAVNPTRSEAVEAHIDPFGEIGGMPGFGMTFSVGIGDGFARRGVTVTFTTFLGSNPVDLALDDEWFRNAHLVVVRTTPMGHVVRPLDVPGVTVCTSKNGEC